MPTVTVKPNDKYRYVIDENDPPAGDASPADSDQAARWDDVAAMFRHEEKVSLFNGYEPDLKSPDLSWSEISPPSDSDLLSVMSTYFDGISAVDPADLIKAKLRLADVRHVAHAQIAAQCELNKDSEP